MNKKTTKEFYVTAHLYLEIDHIIPADTLEDALLQARKLDFTGFITIDKEDIVNDASTHILGVRSL
jgi:hypothetical protein